MPMTLIFSPPWGSARYSVCILLVLLYFSVQGVPAFEHVPDGAIAVDLRLRGRGLGHLQLLPFGLVDQQLPGLQEMNFGDFEMKSYQELKDTAAYQAWITDVEHNVCPNGESAPQVLERNRAAMAQVLASGEDAVCVVHGGVTAGLMMTWFGGGRYDYSVKPGTGFTVTFRDGRPVSYERVPE